MPCDEAGWVNVEQILKYDHIWKDGQYLARTTVPDFTVITKRLDMFQQIILTEFKQTRRVRAKVLALKVAKEELEKVIHLSDRFTRRISRVSLRLEIGNPDREIWLWPVAIRAPMAHTKNPGGVIIEAHKTTYHLNPSVGNMGGGFHCTTFDCMAQIFNEGLRPGGGGDCINTFFVPFAPWDERSVSILRYKKIEGATLVYIYLTYESLSKFGTRISADGHILVQQTIPFNSFDAVWYSDQLLITKGYEQLVLSVRGAKKIATVDRFDHLIENVAQDDASPDKDEIFKLLNIKNADISYAPRIFPRHPRWNEAISLLAVAHRPNKEGYRLCPACLSEIPALLSLCVNCKGYLISHGWRKRIKITVASLDEPERHPNDDEVKDHVKQTWEKIKIDLTSDDDEAQEQDDENVEMGDQTEEVRVEEEEEEEEGSDMDDLNAEKRDFREKDEVDEYTNKEREEVEKDEREEEEIQGGEINLRKFKAGEKCKTPWNIPHG